MPRYRRALWAVCAVVWLATQVPLLRLVVRHHGDASFWKTMNGVVLHAPNQFLFLPIVFPLVLYATAHVWALLADWGRRFGAEITRIRVSLWVGGTICPFLVLAAILGAIDSGAGRWDDVGGESGWRPDWYQLDDWSAVAAAANANRLLVAGECLRPSVRAAEEGASRPGTCASAAKDVREAYASSGPDATLMVFETIELTLAAVVVALLFLGAAICAYVRLSAGDTPGSFAFSEALRREVTNAARPILVAALCLTAFVALRIQNLAEVRAVFPDYVTISPRLLLVGILVLIAFAIAIRFGPADTKLKAAIESVAGFALTAAVAVFAFEPQVLSTTLHSLGSAADWIVFLFITAFAAGLAVLWARCPVIDAE